MALPALLKLAGVMEKGGQDLAHCEQLPIEIELGQEFVYHSIFACPVSRDQSTAGEACCVIVGLGGAGQELPGVEQGRGFGGGQATVFHCIVWWYGYRCLAMAA